MKSFKHRKKEIQFGKITGDVIGQNKYSETNVYSSGGGGYVGAHGGHVNAPSVHSESITNHEFWVKKTDGSELAVQLSGHDIPLREGQKITLIHAGVKGKNGGRYAVLLNHNAGKHWFINKAETLNNKLKIDVVTGKTLIAALAIWLLIGVFYNSYYSWSKGFYVAAFFFVIRAIYKVVRIKRFEKKLNEHLESLAQESYKYE